jgi:hypothetical protein
VISTCSFLAAYSCLQHLFNAWLLHTHECIRVCCITASLNTEDFLHVIHHDKDWQGISHTAPWQELRSLEEGVVDFFCQRMHKSRNVSERPRLSSLQSRAYDFSKRRHACFYGGLCLVHVRAEGKGWSTARRTI